MIRTIARSVNGTNNLPNTWVIAVGPNAGHQWLVTHIAVQSPNWVYGQLVATIMHDQAFICATATGQADSGDGAPIRLGPSEQLIVTWVPSGNYKFQSDQPLFKLSLVVDEAAIPRMH